MRYDGHRDMMVTGIQRTGRFRPREKQARQRMQPMPRFCREDTEVKGDSVVSGAKSYILIVLLL